MKIKLYSSEDLNFVEFSSSSFEEGFMPFSENSRYLHSAVFCLFQYAFELSNPEFEYYRPTAFSDSSLATLRNHMVDQISKIEKISSAEELEAYALKQVAGIDFLNEIKSFYPKWRISWENIRDQVKQVVDELLEIVDFCIDEDRVFWVKGY